MVTRSGSQRTVIGLALVAIVAASLAAAPGPDGMLGALLGVLMWAIAVNDFDHYTIPDELTAAAVALALIRAATVGPDAGWDQVLWVMLKAVASALPLLALMVAYRWWRGRDGIGLGDVKLATAAGAWLDLATVFAMIELAALAALATYLLTAAMHGRAFRSTAMMPFGLFIAPAIWLGWLAEALMSRHFAL